MVQLTARVANRQNEPGTVPADLGDPADARAHHERALAIDAAVSGRITQWWLPIAAT